MSENIINTVLQLTGMSDNDTSQLIINAFLSEILSYLNRSEVTEQMFPVVCSVIADCIKSEQKSGRIQSFREGDLSITYSANSPFFGRLESFKLIRGVD